ncbi:MAG: hypothetical protein ACRDJI_04365 [Actinomycetota bacterium]
MRRKPELGLDRALESESPATDPELADLVDIASRLRRSLAVQTPPSAARQRTLFASGAGAHRPRPSRLLVPAVAAATLVAALGWLSRDALPGDTLYRVREVLQEVGLARSPLDEIDAHIRDARAALNAAEKTLDEDSEQAEKLGFAALGDLYEAESLLDEVSGAGDRESEISDLEARAARVIAIARGLLDDDGVTPGNERGDDGADHSGPGGGEGEGDDSGPGGEGEGEADDDGGDGDNSGPGDDDVKDDDVKDDDNSGPGAGDGADGDDDDSGPGSDDDGNSGKNGGDSDGSGSGSGSDDDDADSPADDPDDEEVD